MITNEHLIIASIIVSFKPNPNSELKKKKKSSGVFSFCKVIPGSLLQLDVTLAPKKNVVQQSKKEGNFLLENGEAAGRSARVDTWETFLVGTAVRCGQISKFGSHIV